jgi:DNA (cytosine-5)-methyltransferase 1
LDLFCCGGGAGYGYHLAGYEVVGVDIAPQPKYPFEFHQADALTFPLDGFDAIHASPPCQAYTRAQKLQGNTHPELIEPIRARLKAAGVPYVIENVVGAPLHTPIMLCGASFGLKVYRHRLFETNFPIVEPVHLQHQWPNVKMGRKPKPGEFIQPVGHFSDVPFAQEAMGIDWLGQDELREAVPPVFTQWIGLQMLPYVRLAA